MIYQQQNQKRLDLIVCQSTDGVVYNFDFLVNYISQVRPRSKIAFLWECLASVESLDVLIADFEHYLTTLKLIEYFRLTLEVPIFVKTV